MAEPPRDPLAEHPLGPEASRRRPRGKATLDLFPDVADAPLGPGDEAAPAGEAQESTRRAPAEDVDEPGEPLPEAVAAEPEAVAFARRVAAGLADLLILALVGAVELAAGALLLELRFPPASLLWVGAFLVLASLVLLVLAPFVWGTTPGMALADLRILAKDGGSPTLAASLLRFVGFLLTGALAGVPLLVAAFDRRGRTLSDLISFTTVAPAEKTPRGA